MKLYLSYGKSLIDRLARWQACFLTLGLGLSLTACLDHADLDVSETQPRIITPLRGEKLIPPVEMIEWDEIGDPFSRYLEGFWDHLNESSEVWDWVGALGVHTWQLGHWGEVEVLDHGIRRRVVESFDRSVDASQWALLLSQLQHEGWRIDATQWRHVGLMVTPESDTLRSTIDFECFANLSRSQKRSILRGTLEVAWSLERKEVIPSEVKLLKLEWLEREGLPPFEHVIAADVSPSEEARVLEPNLQVVDLNGDQRPELILTRVNQVFWNQGRGQFKRSNLVSFLPPGFHQGVFAEFNGDEFIDFLAMGSGGLYLYVGDGKKGFPKPPVHQALFEDVLPNPFTMSAGDTDGDGDLDLWIGQYKVPYRGGQMPTPFHDARDGHPAYLLLNDGHGFFSDHTAMAGFGSKRYRRSYSGSLVDLDGDADLDLLVVSDFAGVDVHQNIGSNQFTDLTADWAGQAGGFGMGHLVSDFDGNGVLDVLMIGMHSPVADRFMSYNHQPLVDGDILNHIAQMNQGNRLLLGQVGQGFQQVFDLPLHRTGWSWGCGVLDVDRDGDRDLYIANGHITGPQVRDYESEFWREDTWLGDSDDDPQLDAFFESKQDEWRRSGASFGGHERNRFFLNLGHMKWVEVGYLFGVALKEDSRNVVIADLDGNGRSDMVVTTFELWPNERQQLHIFPNFLENSNHWIGFHLLEGKTRGSFMGCRIELEVDDHIIPHAVVSGDGFRSQSPYQIQFGLGERSKVQGIRVIWPDGRMRHLDAPQVDRYHTLEPPSAAEGELTLPIGIGAD